MIVVIAALFALPLAASDLRISAVAWPEASRTLGGKGNARGTLRIENAGPGTATGVRVKIANEPQTKVTLAGAFFVCDAGDCRLDRQLAPSERVNFDVFVSAPPVSGRMTITASVSAAAADPDPSNNTVRVVTDFVDQGIDLTPSITLRSPAEYARPYSPSYSFPPEEPAYADVSVWNNGELDATGVVLLITLPEGATALRAESDNVRCDLPVAPVRCEADPIVSNRRDGKPARVRIHFLTPPLYAGGSITAKVTASAVEAETFPINNTRDDTAAIQRFLAVTTTAVDGTGSLRQAIIDANQHCRVLFPAPGMAQICTIGFRIPAPAPASGFFTIEPLTPLPPVNFYGHIQGRTQATVLGEDSDRPLVMIDGSRLRGAEPGLLILSSTDVASLAIGNCPEYGIVLEQRPESIPYNWSVDLTHVYLGIDPSGHTAAPNERGLLASLSSFGMTKSVVSGNRRSGIVITRGSGGITNNRIGVAAASDDPVPNGASGIFVRAGATAGITGNVIANHPHFGVAIESDARGQVEVERNSMYGNYSAIDYGLDGSTPDVPNDTSRFPNQPVIETVTSSGDSTQIRIRLDTTAPPTFFPSCTKWGGFANDCIYTESVARVELYANTRPGAHTQRYLGTFAMGKLADVPTQLTITVTIDEDLRGAWISGVTQRQRDDLYLDIPRSTADTSEASEGVRAPSP